MHTVASEVSVLAEEDTNILALVQGDGGVNWLSRRMARVPVARRPTRLTILENCILNRNELKIRCQALEMSKM